MAKKKHMFRDLVDFLQAIPTLDKDVVDAEFKKYNARERANLQETFYLEMGRYAELYGFDRRKHLIIIKIGEKLYFPALCEITDKMLKSKSYFGRSPQKRYYCPQENRTYTLIG